MLDAPASRQAPPTYRPPPDTHPSGPHGWLPRQHRGLDTHGNGLKRKITGPLECSAPETALRAALLLGHSLQILPAGEREGGIGFVVGNGTA